MQIATYRSSRVGDMSSAPNLSSRPHSASVPEPKLVGTYGDELVYGVVADSLPGTGAHAQYDIRVSASPPYKIVSVVADEMLGVWTDQMRSCLRQGLPNTHRSAESR